MKLDDGIKKLESAIIRFLMEADSQPRTPLSHVVEQETPRRLSEHHWVERLADRWTPAVLELWQTFNTKRSGALGSYFTSADSSRAYIAGFMLPNVLRLTSLVQNSRHLRNLFAPDEESSSEQPTHSICVIDYGAGPLTATFALALAWLVSKPSKTGLRPKSRELVSVVVERSDRAWRDGTMLLELMAPWFEEQGLKISVRRLRAEAVRGGLANSSKPPSWARNGVQLFAAANVLNELSSEDKRSLFKVMIGSLEHGAHALLLEPGQDVHSKRLAGFRDKLLAEHSQWAALEPCPHGSACPLGPSSARSDWCWFRVTDSLPTVALLRSLDQRTGLRHGDLNFSYVLFGPKRSAGSARQTWGRVVSDPIPQTTLDRSALARQLRYITAQAQSPLSPAARQRLLQGRSIKTLVCHQSGSLVGVVPAPGEPPLQRGQLLTKEPLHDALFAERTTKKKK